MRSIEIFKNDMLGDKKIGSIEIEGRNISYQVNDSKLEDAISRLLNARIQDNRGRWVNKDSPIFADAILLNLKSYGYKIVEKNQKSNKERALSFLERQKKIERRSSL